MTSKERAKLKSIASNMDTILQIGKNPIGDTFIKQVADALKARELIKIHVLETCELTASETAEALSEAVGCEVVQVIGSKAILFMRRQKGEKKSSYLDERNGGDAKRKPDSVKDKRKAYSAVKKEVPPKKVGNKSVYYLKSSVKSGFNKGKGKRP